MIFIIYFFYPSTVPNLPDNSLTEQSDSMETHSSNDDIVLSANSPSDQSERKAAGVAEAALQDGEKKHKLLNFILGVNTLDQGAYINHYLTYFILFCLFVFYLGVSLYNLLTVTGLIFFHFVVFMPPQLKH